MNAVHTVGPPGPAPPAKGTSPPAATGADGAAPFADALDGAGQSKPAPPRAAGEPPGPDPGSLDPAILIQLLLGGEPPTGDQSTTDLTAQLDRVAGAGSNGINDAGPPADGAMLVGLTSQLTLPADAPLEVPTVGLPADHAAGRPQPGRGRSSAQQVLPGPAAEVAQGVGVRAADVGVPPVILPSAAAGAPRAEASPVMVPDGEQQHALPMGKAAFDMEPVAPAPSAAAEGQQLAAEGQQPADGSTAGIEVLIAGGSEALPDELSLAPTADPGEPATSLTPASTGEASGEAIVAAASEPVSSSTRSTPVTATEPATPASAEAFTSDLANTVRRATLLGDQEVRLLLNPPELGHLDIRIVESSEGLRVVLEATTAEARELIERQLPLLRSALESRDLRVERLAVEQALEASSAEQESDRGLRQDGQSGDGSEQSGQDGTEWSPVASIQAEASGQPTGSDGEVSESESGIRTAASDGRLDVLA